MNPECDRCLYNAHTPYLLCTVHPEGVKENCLDFKPDPKVQDEDFWSPIGYSWYDGNLVANRPSRLTTEQQIEILDNHPLFTGVCPNCHHRYVSPPLVGGSMTRFDS